MKLNTLAIFVGLIAMVGSDSILAQPQLIVAYDFESDGIGASLFDKSGNGTALDLTLLSGGIVADPDPGQSRGGSVYSTGNGLGAVAVTYDQKLEIQQAESFTLSAWVKSAETGFFSHLVGRKAEGPRIEWHHGLGGFGGSQFDDPFVPPSPENNFENDGLIDFGPGGEPDNEWHHVLVSWNHVTQEIFGYYDGELGPSSNNGKTTQGTRVVDYSTRVPPVRFSIAGGNSGPLPNSFVDDVAFWNGYATQEVAQGLFDGTYTIFDAPIIDPGPSLVADADDDGDVDGTDFLILQRNNPELIADWQNEYGTGVGSVLSTTIVPEPTSGTMLMLCVSVFVIRRRL